MPPRYKAGDVGFCDHTDIRRVGWQFEWRGSITSCRCEKALMEEGSIKSYVPEVNKQLFEVIEVVRGELRMSHNMRILV